MIEKVPDKREYLCPDLGDTRPVIRLGGLDSAVGPKYIPNTNISFSCFSGVEKYYINLNRKDRIVTNEVEALADDVLSLQIGDQTDIWHVDEDGQLEWDIRFDRKPAVNIFDWEMLCSSGLEFFYQPELTPGEIEMGAVRPERAIGSYAVYCDRAGHYMSRREVTRENYFTGKLLHIYRPLVTDAEGKICRAELFIDPGRNLLRITIPQEFLDSAVYPVTLDPTFGYTAAGASYAEITYPYAQDWAAAKHTAGENEVITRYTACCATTTSGVLDAAAYTDGPTTRIGTATGINCVNNMAAWRSSPAVSHAMSNGVTYCCAVGDQSGAPICFYDSAAGGDTSRHGTQGVLPATWNEAQLHTVRISVYATYTVNGVTWDETLTEGLVAGDNLSSQAVMDNILTEGVVVSDSPSSQAIFYNALVEGIVLSDALSNFLTMYESLADGVTLSETLSNYLSVVAKFRTQMSNDVDTFFNTDEHATTITYNGSDIPAIVKYEENLTSSRGVSKKAKAQIWIKVSDVATPAYRDTIVIGDNTWRLLRVLKGDSYVWTLELERDERPILWR